MNSDEKQAQGDSSSKKVTPNLLKESVGEEYCCIFRVHHNLSKHNPEAYAPIVVSIGPLHFGKEHLQMMQEHKRRYLKIFTDIVAKKGMSFSELVDSVSLLEEKIRMSYSENLDHLDREKLIDMMVLDGCFILTLFLMLSTWIIELPDHLLGMPWLLYAITNDLLLLENQLPFFLLQTLFATSKIVPYDMLKRCAFYALGSLRSIKNHRELDDDRETKHLLDLTRQTFIFTSPNQAILGGGEYNSNPFLRFIPSATRLYNQGIRFKARKDAPTLLDITLDDKCVLHIPPLHTDGFIRVLFLNFIAFEQYYGQHSSYYNHITSYVGFMGCLVHEEDDVALLRKMGIIENNLESAKEVTQFFKGISKDVSFDITTSHLADLFERVNKHASSKGFNRIFSRFRRLSI